MALLFYVRLIAFTAGALLHLFLLALIVGHRRPRRFERVLFLLVLALFFIYSGCLLAANATIHYLTPPGATELFAVGVILLGLAALPALLVHAEVECAGTVRADGIPPRHALITGAFYVPLVFFAVRFLPQLIGSSTIHFLSSDGLASRFYGIWLGLALAASAAFEIQISRADIEVQARRFHRILAGCLTLLAMLILSTYGFGFPRDPSKFSILATVVILAGLLPGGLLGYFTLRYNFLQIGMQRNLVYAVSAAFLALLYLAFVRRLGIWFEPVLPPEATAAVLLFILVFLFEPLERVIGRTLYRSFQQRMDRVQRLVLELQREAENGDVQKLISAAERRIRDEFSLSSVRVSLPRGSDWSPLRAPGGLGHCVQFPLREGSREIGLLEACSTGAYLVGETTVALEFLAEQLPALVAHCRLIEEKLRLERELAERERLALVGQMAARISHNLRNPLSSMKTVLQVLLEDQNLAPRVREDCELVVQEMDRLGQKLTELLQYAKPSVRPAEGTRSIGVVSAAQQVVSLLRHEAERYGVCLEFQRGAEEIFVPGSEEAWSDVISNLIVNAIEAQPAGGRVWLSILDSRSRMRMEIGDDGPGIPAGLAARLFQPFFTTKPSGTGLGLAIAARRVAEVGGEIDWESPVREGRGTKFIVTVPLSSLHIATRSEPPEGKRA
jgi:two-component system, NtrC family, sensor histidine kinase HydH